MSGDQSFCGDASSSPWQRMKWTDAMVKLLINIVMLVDDPANLAEPTNSADPAKRKPAPGEGGGALLLQQKKGKWKAVSRAMMTHGCFVAPQQCEDKFNDLNKRYKKLNDILGKGVSWTIVDDPVLLDDAIAHLPPKAKEDIKKLLASKHLFYKEMCAYHNGCKAELHPHVPLLQPHQEPPTDNDNDTDTDDENEGHGEEDHNPFGKRRKISRPLNNDRNLSHLLSTQTGSMKSGEEVSAKQWLEVLHILQIEEQQVRVQFEALELEKERFKWKRIACKQERELERERIENERAKLENDRMALRLKQKELGIECKRSEMSTSSIALILHRLQDQVQKESDVKVVAKQEGHSFGQGVER